MADTNPSSEQSAPAAPPRPSWEIASTPAARLSPRPARPMPPPPPAAAAPRPAAAPSLTMPTAPLMPVADETVRYDLAGNPIAGSGPRPSAYAAPTAAPLPSPYTYSPGPSSVGSWPPAPSGGALVCRNTSGEQSDVPPEIACKRWHWGAFFFPILWLRRHNMTAQAGMISAALFVPRVLHNYTPAPLGSLLVAAALLAYWAVRIYFGWSGHKFAWRNRHFPDGVTQYFKVQQAWMLWGFGVFALDIGIQIFVLGALLAAANSMPSGGAYTHRAYSNSGYNGGVYSRPRSDSPQ